MHIKDFTQQDIESAKKLALENYNEERGATPFLPMVEDVPDLSEFASNGLGVAMFEGLLGQNKLTVDLVEMTATRAFDTTDKAVEVLAEVQTGDFADLSKTIMFFALGMLLVSGWIVRE